MASVLEIELFGNCNLKCVMCAQQFPDKRQRAISFEEFRAIFELYKPESLDYITLHGSGEVMLSPIFGRVLDFIPDGLPIRFLTNGTQIAKQKEHLLNNADKIEAIDISIDACTPQTYKRIRGGVLSDTLESISTISSNHLYKNKIRLNFTYHKHNYKEIPLLASLASSIQVSRVGIWPLVDSAQYLADEWAVSYNDRSADEKFNYRESLVSCNDPLLLKYLAQLQLACQSHGVDIVLPEFYNIKNEMMHLKPSDCPVVEYNRIYYSTGEAKHCCLQTKPVFNWFSEGAKRFEAVDRHHQIVTELKEDHVPSECEHSGCPYIANFDHIPSSDPSEITFQSRTKST